MLSFIRLELSFATDARHDKAPILLLVDEAGGNKLPEQVDRCITLRVLGLHLLNLGLKGVKFHELGLGSLLFQNLSIMLVFDLLVGPFSLGSILK